MAFLSKKEKTEQIELIIKNGLVVPETLISSFKRIYQSLGMKVIFRNHLLFISIILLSMLVVGISSLSGNPEYPFSIQIMMIPITYVLLVTASELLERVSGLYDLKMTFKYTVSQLIAFRMALFSAVGTVLCIITSALLSVLFVGGKFISLLTLSLFSLFLFALLSLYILRVVRGYKSYLGISLAWIFASLFPLLIFKKTWEDLLSGMSPLLSLLAVVIIITLFIKEIKKMIKVAPKKENINAFN